MYRTCLFCSASLGTNEAIESFPVGTRLAFDAWKGRLWAVCRRCGRWNLAPIEERWEAVEQAERLFADTRSRVQSENIGLCRLPDGTRLVRVGKALPGELAAWRYGSQLVSRRNRNLAYTGLGVLGAGAIIAGLPLIASIGTPVALLNIGVQATSLYRQHVAQNRVVHRIAAARSPTGARLEIRRRHLTDAVLEPDSDGGVGLLLTSVNPASWKRPATGWKVPAVPPVHIAGDEARRVLARAMSDYNSRGAKRDEVQRALRTLEEAGGPEHFVRSVAASGALITRPPLVARQKQQSYSFRQIAGTFRGEVLPVKKVGLSSWRDEVAGRLSATDALALEMALNEEAERAALEGELAALEAAWREAEEIAHIADALPDVPPPQRQQQE